MLTETKSKLSITRRYAIVAEYRQKSASMGDGKNATEIEHALSSQKITARENKAETAWSVIMK